ncbi:MAG: hypothetical protein ACFFBU_05345 [Promethearchaeota archaeon]
MAEFMIICLIVGICLAIGKSVAGERESRGERRERSYHTSRSSRRSSSSRTTRRPSGQVFPIPIDRASSPIGGTCINCGAIIEEETSRQCPSCGVDRQRCPICQRFIAGDQELLGCPSCEILAHKNEIVTWVRQREKCPHCGVQLSASMLVSPEFIKSRK